MKKWLGFGILMMIVIGAWFLHARTGKEIDVLNHQIGQLEEKADPEEKIPGIKDQINTLEGQKTFNGILLAFLSAGVVGIFFVVQVLPMLAHRMTHGVYDSGEELEPDPMHEARVLLAQGKFEEAIQAFRTAAAATPENRLPWVEIAKIQKSNLENPAAAVATYREALESHPWQVDDAAFLLFRLAELYDDDLHDRDAAVVTLQVVVQQFPETRHSANAMHKLREWGIA